MDARGVLRAFFFAVLVAVCTAGCVAQSGGGQPAATARPATALDRVAPYRRCLWVSRWEYSTAKDIEKIFYNAASARFTDVMFQVRGEGTVAYASALEPWAWGLSGDDPECTGKDPGWDPLAVAVKEAHRWGVRIHAYMNVMPGWAQKTSAPKGRGQLWSDHPDWFMVERSGKRMNPARWYAFVDPGLPQVREHLARLFGEVAARYAVDGVHLDYVRYPTGVEEEAGDFSYHPQVVAAFKKQFGKEPAQLPKQWAQWRRDQVTATVRAISQAVRTARPGTQVTAAVIAEYDKSFNRGYQSSLQWLDEGLLDAIAPMSYCGTMDKYEELVAPYMDPKYRGRVWLGVWANPQRNGLPDQQARWAVAHGAGGVSVFSYGYLFDNHRSGKRARLFYDVFTARGQSSSGGAKP